MEKIHENMHVFVLSGKFKHERTKTRVFPYNFHLVPLLTPPFLPITLYGKRSIEKRLRVHFEALGVTSNWQKD